MTTPMPPLALPLDSDSTATQVDPGGSLIIQSRLIQAPRERVWDAWTDPAQLGQWWGPRGFSVTTTAYSTEFVQPFQLKLSTQSTANWPVGA